MDDFTDTLVSELVDKFVLDEAFTQWMNDWKAQYASIINDENLPEEKRIRLIKGLMQDLADKHDELNEKARTWTEAFKTQEDVFSDLGDSFKESILDMERTADDFAASLKTSFRRAITNSFIMTPEVKSQIEELVKTANELTSPDYKGEAGESLKERYREMKEFFEGYGIWEEDLEKGYEEYQDFLESIGYQPEEIRALWDEYVALVEAVNNLEYSDEDRAKDIEAHAQALKALYDSVEASQDYWDKILGFASETSPFDDLRDTFLDTLTDMEADAESFGKKLEQTLVKNLLEKLVLDVPLTVSIDGEDKVFESFDKYSEDWNGRYLKAVKALQEARKSGDAEAIAEAQAAVDALLSEVVGVYTQLEEGADEFRRRLEEMARGAIIADMGDSVVSSLMDAAGDVEDIANDMKKTIVRKLVEAFMVSEQIKPLLEELQATFDAVMGMEGLTPEERAQMMKEGFTGTDEEGNAKVFVGIDDEGVTERLKSMQEVVRTLMEAIGVEFDRKEGFSDLRGAFVSALTDMEGDAETFGKSIGKTMLEQMLDAYIDNTYKEQIKALNEEWTEALASGDPAKIESIREKVVALYAAIGDDEAVKQLALDLKELESEADTTFTDMADSWAESLMGMSDTAEDWAKEVGRAIAKKIVSEMVVPTMIQPLLDSLQKAMDAALSAEGATIQSVIDAVLPFVGSISSAYEELQPLVEQIMNTFGIFREEAEESVEDVEYALGDLRSTFVSSLMDMESDAESFATTISKIMAEAFIDKFVLGEEFDKRLEEWKAEYASIMGGSYSEEERASLLKQLRESIQTAEEGYAAEAAAIHDLMGTSNYGDQEATLNMSEKATYDQFELYLGMQTSMVMMTQQGNAVRQQILSTLQSMSGITTGSDGSSNYGQQIFLRLGTTNDYLLAIKKSNEAILNQFSERLNSIINKLS